VVLDRQVAGVRDLARLEHDLIAGKDVLDLRGRELPAARQYLDGHDARFLRRELVQQQQCDASAAPPAASGPIGDITRRSPTLV